MRPLQLFDDLSSDRMSQLLPEILADDSGLTDSNWEKSRYSIIMPSSITMAERMDGSVSLVENELDFHSWMNDIIVKVLYQMPDLCSKYEDEHILETVYRNILFLFNMEYRDSTIAAHTWNQEVSDIVEKVCLFTFGMRPGLGMDLHSEFNSLAFHLIPEVIKKLDLLKEENLELVLRLSIASGVSGLDLKGTVAAASDYAYPGIPLSQLSGKKMTLEDIDSYCASLLEHANKPAPLFFLEDFLKNVSSLDFMVWFTDDVIESMFDLIFIQKILAIYPSLTIAIIPKNGQHANDLSWSHLERLLTLPLFNDLSSLSASNRFVLIHSGPRMGTVNLSKLSPEVNKLLEKAGMVLIKGCRNHEMTQGGLPVPSYTGYTVARGYSELVTGYKAEHSPLLFFPLGPNRFAFYGFSTSKYISAAQSDAEPAITILSSTKDHFRRSKILDAHSLVEEFATVFKHIEMLPEREKIAAILEADELAEKLVLITRDTYDRTARDYASIRWEQPHELDEKLWRTLIEFAEENIYNGSLVLEDDEFYLLDVGAGNGRDLQYAQNELGLHAIGLDNSDTFIDMVKELEAKKIIMPGSIMQADMRDLSVYDDRTFDIVRHNATLLHLPVISKGYMADKAVAESYRVLKNGGIIFVFVKEGQGISIVDTREGLGSRFFQFYDEVLLNSMLKRNGFTILQVTKEIEIRG